MSEERRMDPVQRLFSLLADHLRVALRGPGCEETLEYGAGDGELAH